jgi:hypothetical protein
VPDLATVDDLEDRIGDLTDAQIQRAPALLKDASGIVRRYTRQNFEHVTNDEIVLRPVGSELRLPQRPVTAVHSVHAIGGRDGVPDVALGGWLWDGIDKIHVGGIGWTTAINYDLELDAGWVPDTYRINHDHGYETIPDDIVALVCGMVNRVLTAPSLTEGMVGESIGQYRYQMQQGAGSAGPAVRLTEDDKRFLKEAGYKRTAGTIQLRT